MSKKKINSPLLYKTIKKRVSYEKHYQNQEVKAKKYFTDSLFTTGYYKPISCLK